MGFFVDSPDLSGASSPVLTPSGDYCDISKSGDAPAPKNTVAGTASPLWRFSYQNTDYCVVYYYRSDSRVNIILTLLMVICYSHLTTLSITYLIVYTCLVRYAIRQCINLMAVTGGRVSCMCPCSIAPSGVDFYSTEPTAVSSTFDSTSVSSLQSAVHQRW